jgi:sulfite exporter TauE/SafE
MQFPVGFLLGLSTGAVCLAYCGPVLLPFIMGQGNTISKNAVSVSLFLTGRLVAYLIVGILSGLLGILFLQKLSHNTLLFGLIYSLLAVLMMAYGFFRFREVCLGAKVAKGHASTNWQFMVPLAGGFATGLNVCPPFLLAITGAADEKSITGSLLFFVFFYLGTLIYFLPMPFIGFFRHKQALRIVGKFAAILAGFIYLYKGIVLMIS